MTIEQHAPELERIIDMNAPVEELAGGYGGDMGPAEGPLWWKEGGYLLFSDIHNNRRMKWADGEGATLFAEPTNRANGLTRDRQGRLLAGEHDARRVTRQEPDGSITVVANNYRATRLNRPNDVVVKSDGAIYFTDPITLGLVSDLDYAGVYRVTPDLGTMNCLVWDFVVPNGLAFSPDESVLYINDSRRGHIRAFDLDPTNGTLARATDRIFCDLQRREARRTRRHESGRGGQRLLRRLRRSLDNRPQRQAPWHHRPRVQCHHQPRLRRRRLENPLLHHPQRAMPRTRQDSRNPRALGARLQLSPAQVDAAYGRKLSNAR